MGTMVPDGDNIALGKRSDTAITNPVLDASQISLLKGLLTILTAGGGAGSTVTIADGADITQGEIADAVVAAGAAGTASAKLRRLTTDLAAILVRQADGTQVAVTKEKWFAQSAVTALLLGADVAPTLKSLANAALVLSNAYDNTSNLYGWMDLVLNVRGASAFTAGGTLDYWIIKAVDGANYEDGSASVTPEDGSVSVTPERPPDGYFFLRAVSTQQVIAASQIQIPPYPFKVLVRNSGGQALTGTDAENTLDGYFH